MDRNRIQSDDMDSDENIPLRKRRSSILKSRKSIVPDLDDTALEAAPSVRRVSFAASNFVKPFVADPDRNTIWDTTYEEEVNHTDSTKSESTNPTMSTKCTSELETMTICGPGLMEISPDLINFTLQHAKLQERTLVYEKNEGEMEMTLQQNNPNITQCKTQIVNTTQNLQTDMSMTCHFPNNMNLQNNENIAQSKIQIVNVTQNLQADMSMTCRFPNNMNLQQNNENIAQSKILIGNVTQNLQTDMSFTCRFGGNTDNIVVQKTQNSPMDVSRQMTDMSLTCQFPGNNNWENQQQNHQPSSLGISKEDVRSISIIEYARQKKSLRNSNVTNNVEKENAPVSLYPIKSRQAIGLDIIDKENLNVPLIRNFTKNSEQIKSMTSSCSDAENMNLFAISKLNSSENRTQFMDISDHHTSSRILPVIGHVENFEVEHSINPNQSRTVLENTHLDDIAISKFVNDADKENLTPQTQQSLIDFSMKCQSKINLVSNIEHSRLDMSMKPTKIGNQTTGMLLEESHFVNLPKTENDTQIINNNESVGLTSRMDRSMKSLLEDSMEFDMEKLHNPIKLTLTDENISKVLPEKPTSQPSLENFKLLLDDEKCDLMNISDDVNFGMKSSQGKSTYLVSRLTESGAMNAITNEICPPKPEPLVESKVGSTTYTIDGEIYLPKPETALVETMGSATYTIDVNSFKNNRLFSDETKHDTVKMDEEFELVDPIDDLHFSLKSDRAKSADPVHTPVGISRLDLFNSSSFSHFDDTNHFLKLQFQKSNIDQSNVSKSNMETDIIQGSEATLEASMQLNEDSLFENVKNLLKDVPAMRPPEWSKYETELKETEDLCEQAQAYLKNYTLPKLNTFDIKKAREEILLHASPNHSRNSMETTLFVRRDSQGLDLLATVQERVVKLCAKLLKNHIKIENRTAKDDRFLFSTLYGSLFIYVKINPDNGQVLDIRFSSLLEPECPKICRFTEKFVLKKLNIKNLSSYLGEGFDVLTLLDYIYMTVEEGLAFQKNFVKLFLCEEYSLLKIDEDFNIACAFLNLCPPLGWQVIISMHYVNKLQYENIKIVSVLDSYEIKDDCIKKLFTNVEEGPNCLKSFLDSLYHYFKSELANMPKPNCLS